MNRYSIFALVLIAIVIIFITFNVDDDGSETITGYADDIHQKDTGTTFTIVDVQGNHIKAFSRMDVDTSLHEFKGNYSADGGIFFVNEIDHSTQSL